MTVTLVRVGEHFDTVVVGGGQAGLAVAYELHRAGRSYVVLDAAARIGDAWRHRWDSLRLFTPAGVDGLPGTPFPAHGSHRPTKDEMADFVEAYARCWELSVRSATRVTEVRSVGDSFAIAANATSVTAGQVVIATGPYTVPRVPPFAASLTVAHLHASTYRSPDRLPPGPVLVVGAGNSGGEIAMDIAASHRTWLSGRDTGRLPFPAFSAPFRILPHVRSDRGFGRAVRSRLTGRGSPLVRIGSADLAAAGVLRVPRVTGVVDGLPRLADGRVLDVACVVWCTGYRDDFRWLPAGAHDGSGAPVHRRGIAHRLPGLAFAGLRFQTTLASGIVGGAASDARTVVAALRSR